MQYVSSAMEKHETAVKTFRYILDVGYAVKFLFVIIFVQESSSNILIFLLEIL